MDLHKVFESISIQLVAEFNKSSQVKHSGGKGDLREDAFRNFLSDYLPRKYGAGRGEVITSNNEVSGELDIVIYDNDHCPLFIKSSSHSVYPLESVYGAISMKSHLDSAELKDAIFLYASLKKILRKESFTLNATPGFSAGLSTPVPITGVVAYAANRSIDAIAKQVSELDKELPDIELRPDFVAVIGEGIVGPREGLRDEINRYNLSTKRDDLSKIRRTGRHTLLKLYMQVLRELNITTLRPLELDDYLDMPRIIGKYRVKKHDRFVSTPDNGEEASVKRFNLKAIEEIVSRSSRVTVEQHFINLTGAVPQGIENMGYDLKSFVFEYNPNNLPPVSISEVELDKNNRPVFKTPVFQPVFLYIDGEQYAVDIRGFGDEMFEEEPDFTVNELMSS